VASILVRNFLNSIVRCPRCSEEIKVPSAVSNAANRLVCRAENPGAGPSVS
jgi:hypothetical protein